MNPDRDGTGKDGDITGGEEGSRTSMTDEGRIEQILVNCEFVLKRVVVRVSLKILNYNFHLDEAAVGTHPIKKGQFIISVWSGSKSGGGENMA